jgi:hypothetical protein
MRLYELLSKNAEDQLNQLNQPQQQQVPGADPDASAQEEDDGQGKFDADKVQNSLQDVAQSVNDQNAQPDLPAGAEQTDPALSDDNVKPIDSALLSQIKNLPFASKYKFSNNAPLAPLKIAAMSVADLGNLRNMVRYKIQMATIQENKISLDEDNSGDDTDMQFYIDLLKFINTVTKFKTTNTSTQLSAYRSAPAYQNMQGSK